ncbi:hypothetical protein J2T02_002566 [Chitinophaga terrae (ex Kim and Jung 2007)]|uniref:helix-turn-helix domain-containing protein n=1 Tax=Chitinophaga terrae (ex Kim and Jung 2007) TaxID=408074 RepID=UPI0027808E63|nr:helix-turn-helix domain-containing protein [Chitinophaga terrae (ex Kim and Jung 2007)]MDQ0107447.1 hypothetical protein [Chitinophaga terrae (ex Kim and Jung 2007)]
MSAVEIVTKDDLLQFKNELLTEIQHMLARVSPPEPKRWLKTWEVKKLLGLSSGTLQTMRNNGTLTYSMIGNLAFYDYDEIQALVENNKVKKNANTLLKLRK